MMHSKAKKPFSVLSCCGMPKHIAICCNAIGSVSLSLPHLAPFERCTTHASSLNRVNTFTELNKRTVVQSGNTTYQAAYL